MWKKEGGKREKTGKSVEIRVKKVEKESVEKQNEKVWKRVWKSVCKKSVEKENEKSGKL